MVVLAHRWPLAVALIAWMAFPTAAGAADEPKSERDPGKVVVQSGTTAGVPVNAALPPFKLSDAELARIQEVLATQHADVSLNLKKTAAAKSFEPKLGVAIPKGLEPQAFPLPLISEIPVTRQYGYLKFEGQVLIVNPMTKKIVDLFPETKG
jgi:hypothetical protein